MHMYTHPQILAHAHKAVADGLVGEVLARPLFLKVNTKFNFIEIK